MRTVHWNIENRGPMMGTLLRPAEEVEGALTGCWAVRCGRLSRVQMYRSSPEQVALTSRPRRIQAGDARQPLAEVQVSEGPLSQLGGPVCRADPTHSRAGCRQSWAKPLPGRLCWVPGPV